jgi:hypothetical protein
MIVLPDVALSGFADICIYSGLGGTYASIFRAKDFSVFQMEAALSSEMLVRIHHTK